MATRPSVPAWRQSSADWWYRPGYFHDVVRDGGEWFVMAGLKVKAGPFETPRLAMGYVERMTA